MNNTKSLINLKSHLFLIIASLILSLIILEILLRIKWQKKLPDQRWRVGIIYQEDNKLIYTLKPNASRIFLSKEFKEVAHINNLGFRNNNNINKQKSDNTFRIITVGDSFTFGHGLNDNETYPEKLLRKMQNQYKNRTIEVLNAGVPGYGPDQEYSLIINRLFEFDPDLIIWNLTSYDYYDMTSAIPSLYSIDKKGDLITLNARKNWLYLQNKFLIYTPKFIQNTYLFDFLISQLSRLSFLSGRPSFDVEKLTDWAYTKLVKQIDEVNKISKSKKFKLLIVRLPTKAEFNNDSPKYFNYFFTKLKNYLGYSNISYIDLSDNIKQINNLITKDNSEKVLGLSKINTEELFYKNDSHPTYHGAEVISSILSNYITDRILLPN